MEDQVYLGPSTPALEFIGKGEVKKFKFKRIHGNDKAVMYEVTRPSGGKHYGAFLLIAGVKYPGFCYPKSKSFGTATYKAKCYTSYNLTKEWYDKITNRANELSLIGKTQEISVG